MASSDSEDSDILRANRKKVSKRKKKKQRASRTKLSSSSDDSSGGDDKKHKKKSKKKSEHTKSKKNKSSKSTKEAVSSKAKEKNSDSDSDSTSDHPYDTGIKPIEKPFDGFYVMCSGQIESAEFYGIDNLYCKYTFYYGQHWTPVAGVETAVSQISRKGREQSTVVTWNFPLEVTFRSASAHGWPRLVLSVYSIDIFGRDVVRGYGSLAIPPFPGRYVRYCRVFRPRSSSTLQSVLAWLTVSE